MQTDINTPIKTITKSITMTEAGSRTIMDLLGEIMPAIIEIQNPDELRNLKKILESSQILMLGNLQTINILLGYLNGELAQPPTNP
jgi:hypothetical protein